MVRIETRCPTCYGKLRAIDVGNLEDAESSHIRSKNIVPRKCRPCGTHWGVRWFASKVSGIWTTDAEMTTVDVAELTAQLIPGWKP